MIALPLIAMALAWGTEGEPNLPPTPFWRNLPAPRPYPKILQGEYDRYSPSLFCLLQDTDGLVWERDAIGLAQTVSIPLWDDLIRRSRRQKEWKKTDLLPKIGFSLRSSYGLEGQQISVWVRPKEQSVIVEAAHFSQRGGLTSKVQSQRRLTDFWPQGDCTLESNQVLSKEQKEKLEIGLARCFQDVFRDMERFAQKKRWEQCVESTLDPLRNRPGYDDWITRIDQGLQDRHVMTSYQDMEEPDFFATMEAIETHRGELGVP